MMPCAHVRVAYTCCVHTRGVHMRVLCACGVRMRIPSPPKKKVCWLPPMLPSVVALGGARGALGDGGAVGGELAGGRGGRAAPLSTPPTQGWYPGKYLGTVQKHFGSRMNSTSNVQASSITRVASSRRRIRKLVGFKTDDGAFALQAVY